MNRTSSSKKMKRMRLWIGDELKISSPSTH
jgi:hypothetical protein